jgi:CheY-like chemotaxis protein
MFGSPDRPVLVVEDDADLREVLAALLENEGYPTVTANDGADALSLLADGERPFLILLDWMMPNVDGAAFRRRQLATPALAGIPVVILSAAPPEALARDSASATVPVVLRKPVDFDRLLHVVARYHAKSIARALP